jgi:TatD DNase family protein
VNFIDAHCHLSDERIWPEARKLIAKAIACGVTRMKIGGVCPSEWDRQVQLEKEFPGVIYTSFGLHPWWVEKLSRNEIESALNQLESRLLNTRSIGETGLDFFSKRDPKRFADQEFAFRTQLRFAKQAQLPVVLHIVKAHEEAIQIIREEKALDLKMQVHSYSGSTEEAKAWIKLGACLSFSGNLLRTNSNPLAETLLITPHTQLLFETDAPDQRWQKGRPNEPHLVTEIYEKAAILLNLPLKDLTQIVAENFFRFA